MSHPPPAPLPKEGADQGSAAQGAASGSLAGAALGRPGGGASRTLLWILLAALVLAWFGPLDHRKLIKPDEGRYAEIAREMAVSGDWVTPRMNGIKYFEKPPLQYWATAASFKAFGEHDWSARLWPALTGFLGILATVWATARLFGANAGLAAGAMLAGSLWWGLIGHFNTLDMGLSFFLATAVFCFALAQRDEATPKERRNGMLGAWACIAAAVLSKGLIGLVLPGATLVAYTLWQRDWALWRRLHLLSGLALFFALTVPWFVLVSLANAEFAHFFFIHEHFQRFTTQTHGRYQPAWYFVPILFVGMLPWATLFPAGLLEGLKRAPERRFQPQRFLMVWIVVVFGFFSASGSKLASYILPIFPAIAALTGIWFARGTGRALVWHALPLLVLGAVALFLAPGVVDRGETEVPAKLYAAYVPWLQAASLGLIAAAVAAMALAWRGRAQAAWLVLAAGGMFSTQGLLLGHESLAPSNSTWALVQRIKERIAPEAPVYFVNTFDHTLPYYLKRTVTMAFYKDELSHGIGVEPEKFIPDFDSFDRAWRTAPVAWAIMPPDMFEIFHKLRGLPMEIVDQDPRRIVVRKP